jgi:hypothetical protein
LASAIPSNDSHTFAVLSEIATNEAHSQRDEAFFYPKFVVLKKNVTFAARKLQCGKIWTDCNHNKKSLKQHVFYSKQPIFPILYV